MNTSARPCAMQTVIERDVIKLSDALVHSTITAIDASGRNRITQAGDAVRVDLSAVTRVDSSALALLMGWQRHARRQNKCLSLVAVPANLASMMQLTGADALFDIVQP
jgi:phospholipid transport system transporter-binding protein